MQPKKVLDGVYNSLGDIMNFRSVGELPRNSQDIYYVRRTAKSQNENEKQSDKICPWMDKLWEVLTHA